MHSPYQCIQEWQMLEGNKISYSTGSQKAITHRKSMPANTSALFLEFTVLLTLPFTGVLSPRSSVCCWSLRFGLPPELVSGFSTLHFATDAYLQVKVAIAYGRTWTANIGYPVLILKDSLLFSTDLLRPFLEVLILEGTRTKHLAKKATSSNIPLQGIEPWAIAHFEFVMQPLVMRGDNVSHYTITELVFTVAQKTGQMLGYPLKNGPYLHHGA
ncbi:hypothetical protein PM082_011379 [Marasmius tenuissimus]|nr:hypothetical protein PM082_011379 [Marasmius tenuissimus]